MNNLSKSTQPKNVDLNTLDGSQIARPKNPFYRTTNQEYQPNWCITNDNTIKDYTVPTFDQV